MNQKLLRYIKPVVIQIVAALFVFVSAPLANAFQPDFYCTDSRLASGRWVKVSVSQSGIHRITLSDLRKMGFSDINSVRVFGYGGEVISNQLSNTNYRDDLPEVQTEVASDGIYFYAQGPDVREYADTRRYRFATNPFSSVGYYFITDSQNGEPAREIASSATPDAASPATTFNEILHYEKDLTSVGETGHLFVGDDFRHTSSRSFKFTIADAVTSEKGWIQTSFICRSAATARVGVQLNGKDFPSLSTDNIAATTSEYTLARESRSSRQFDLAEYGIGADGSANVTINLSGSGVYGTAALNYITINYTRLLKVDKSGNLDFWLQGAARLDGVDADTRIWDVTNSLEVSNIRHSNGLWSPSYGGERHYVAWKPGNAYPSPKLTGTVSNQNIHAMETPDMIIFAHSDWVSQAERLANLHRGEPDNMKVLVLNWNDVYNEFSSGVPDVSAFRKCLKMFHDRPGERTLRYGIMFGRSTFDNRKILSSTPRNAMPTWQTTGGLSDNDSYTTDDFFGFLADNSGVNMSADKLDIAIGRIPARTLTEARTMVDKIITYVTNPPAGSWKNNILLIADDQDSGTHMTQTERFVNEMMETDGSSLVFNKVYMDAYPLVGHSYPGARADMFRYIDEGTLWWNFIGHANTTSWTHENLLTYNDMNNLYNRRWPIVYAATCNFLRWDSNQVSAAEILFKNDQGGVIAVISATRPVFISDNGNMSAAVGRHAFTRDENGRYIPVGEAIRRAKNDYREEDGQLRSNFNKLRYVFLGDPAMRPAIPDYRAVVTHINGVSTGSEEPPVIMASQKAKVEGYISDGNTPLNDFNGTLSATLFDADYSTTSLGNGDAGEQVTFEQHGSRLYAGSTKISEGNFELNIPMPAEIADNYRPATLSLFATETKGSREAAGVSRDFYVYGFDDTAGTDTQAPVIEAFYLNHTSFSDGDIVNPSPMVLATVSDDVAINLSTAGIGHQMTLYLDRPEESYPDVASYFTPAADGSPSGTIAYPLTDLNEGEHTLTLRVWDTGGNYTEKTISFIVSNDAAVKVFDIYSDANPASAEANFYLVHNRPDAMVTVTMEVYNIAGRQVWTSTQNGRSDLFGSFPIKWNLCDMAGRRVERGIYIYRAQMKESDGTVSNSVSRKIAVTAR